MAPIILVVWLASTVLGFVIGKRKNRAARGLILGLLLGPIGVIRLLFLDTLPPKTRYRPPTRDPNEEAFSPQPTPAEGWAAAKPTPPAPSEVAPPPLPLWGSPEAAGPESSVPEPPPPAI